MGKKNKIKRFSEIGSFPNVYEVDPATETFVSNIEGISRDLKGQWAANHFHNHGPIILELGCGKGDYAVVLASHHPDLNFIGVDIKGARVWVGANAAIRESLHNVAFLRTRIEFIERFFSNDEIAEIWITFPDPFEGKETRRLTSPEFIGRYRKILKPNGLVHLKTDSGLLYEYTLEVIHSDARCHLLYNHPDIYSEALAFDELKHKTYYEQKHLAENRTIKYIRFTI